MSHTYAWKKILCALLALLLLISAAPAPSVLADSEDAAAQQPADSSGAEQAPTAEPTDEPTQVPAADPTPAPTSEQAPAADYSGAQKDVLLVPYTSSEQVRFMVNRLIELGYYSGGSTSNYSKSVLLAVKAFQKANGLSADGQAGPQTLERLYSSSAITAAAAESAAKTATPAPTEAPAASTAPAATSAASGQAGGNYAAAKTNVVLNTRSSGEQVELLTRRLAELGYYTGEVSSKYTTPVVNAVKAFQKANGLYVDGLAGPRTLALLYGSASAATPAPTPAPTPASTPTPEPTPVPAASETPAESATAVPEATETPAPTPAPATDYSAADVNQLLRPNSTNEQVRLMVCRLTELGYYTGASTSTYTSAVVLAVKAFQRANSLASDGQAGPKTLAKLYSSSAVAVPTPEAAPAATPGSDYSAAKTNIVLNARSSGVQVELLVARLCELGYYTGSATSRCTAEVQAAVKAFQKANGLYVDGIAGPNTLTSLYSAGCVGIAPTPAPSATPEPSAESDPGPVVVEATPVPSADPAASESPAPDYSAAKTNITMTTSSSGEQVALLVTRLRELGYETYYATDHYNADVVAAVKAFQKANGLYADGIAGPKTLTKLYSASPNPYTPAPTVAPITDYSRAQTNIYLAPGDQSEQVTMMVCRLMELGYYSGEVTYHYTNAVMTAVKWFQNSNALTIDGSAGPQTLTKLYSDSAITAQQSMTGIAQVPATVEGESVKPTLSSTVESKDWFSSGSYFDRVTGLFRIGAVATVTDIDTGISYQVQRVGGYDHADVEPLTAYDTQQMYRIYNYTWSWTRRAVYVTIDGITLAASINGMPHPSDYLAGNNMDGHTCIHFLNSKTHGSQKVDADHQAAVQKALHTDPSTVQGLVDGQQ